MMIDRFSMHFSIEARVPFLDRELVEKIMGIRIEWQELLTRTETFYIVGIVLVAIALIWIVQNMIVIRRLKLQ